MPEIKRVARRRRIFELRVLGLTIPQISQKLKKEGFVRGTSEHQVFDDLHSDQAKAYVEELLRKQFADITLASDDLETRLKYRDRLLDKFMPKKVEQEVKGEMGIVWKAWRPKQSDDNSS